MRLFFGVPVDEAVRERVAEFQDRLKRVAEKVNWVQPANFHLTLRFLGETPADRVPQVADAADGVWSSVAPGEGVLRGVGAFPNPRSPRVAWVGLTDGAEVLRGLAKALDAALQASLGLAPEGRELVPHLTIGRVQQPRRDPALEAAIAELASAEAGSFTISRLVLYQSTLRPGGPIYTPVRTYDAQPAA
jgi:2'-5' RNA ligase